MADIADHTFDTQIGQTYCLTAAGSCAVTAQINGSMVTLVSITGGQGTFVAPVTKVTLVGEGCLTRCFKSAAPAAQGGGNVPTPVAAEPLFTVGGDSPILTMQHAVWLQVAPTAAGVSISPSATRDRALSMQLLLAPAADMPAGWLNSTDPALPVFWPYGESMLAGGFRYCVTVVQMPWGILANMTPLGAQPAA